MQKKKTTPVKKAVKKTATKKAVKKAVKPATVVAYQSPEPAIQEQKVLLPAPAVKTGKDIFLEKAAKQNDNIFVNVELKKLSELTGLRVKKGFSVAVISEGEIVNVVSPTYGLVENEKYFLEVERQLIESDIEYIARSTNRGNKDFAVDYILSDKKYHVNVKGNNDRIIPMLRFTNTYGGGPCSGNFGFFRGVCENGLHVAETKVGFKVLHRAKVLEIVLPNIKDLVAKFLNNEFYSLQKKFEVLAETPITDLNDFVKYTCTKLDLFKFEASEKNPNTPSAKANEILETIARECKELSIEPNLWIGYNAFNNSVHASKKQSFNRQRKVDTRLFNTILEMAN